MRGKFEDVPVILASATPAIETRQQVAVGNYAELKLPGRYGAAELPPIEPIDLLQNPPERGRWIAPPLVKAIEETLERREQVLLFLNRRGYAPLTLCRTCGHRFQCPNCTAWMVEHRLIRRLSCHHCGHMEPTPRVCPACDNEDTLVPDRPRRRTHRRRSPRALPRSHHRHRHQRHDLVPRQGRRIRQPDGERTRSTSSSARSS